MKSRFLAAKKILLVVILVSTNAVGRAGIPVIDGAGLSQHILTTIENIAQTLQQIQEYQTQLQQYQDQLRNSLNPSSFIWDQATSTISDLRNTVDTLAYYKNQLGSLDQYLGKFGDIDYYNNSPCFNGGICSSTEREKLVETRQLASESQKKANDALFKGLDDQQDAMEDDAYRLSQLQIRVQSSSGRMEALQYANQLASNQANQLLQLRGLMMAQMNADATRRAAKADEEAVSSASASHMSTTTYTPAPQSDY